MQSYTSYLVRTVTLKSIRLRKVFTNCNNNFELLLELMFNHLNIKYKIY